MESSLAGMKDCERQGILVCCHHTNYTTSAHYLLVPLISLNTTGYDTSSTTLTRCLSNLHDHPDVLGKLRAEQSRVEAKHGRHITSAALKDMPYAEAVLRCVAIELSRQGQRGCLKLWVVANRLPPVAVYALRSGADCFSLCMQ